MEKKHIIMIIVAIVIIIIILVIIVVLTSSTLPIQPPQTLTITWLSISSSTVVMPTLIPENGIYTLTLGTSLESYNIGISNIMAFVSPGFIVKYIYEITGDYPDVLGFDASKVVFIKYVDSDGVNRFALVSVFTSTINAIIRTMDDVGTLIDPTKYTGTWLSSNNLSTAFITSETLRIS